MTTRNRLERGLALLALLLFLYAVTDWTAQVMADAAYRRGGDAVTTPQLNRLTLWMGAACFLATGYLARLVSREVDAAA